MNLVKKLDISVDMNQIVKECNFLINNYGLIIGKDIQLCLQHSLHCENKWHDGTGSLGKKFAGDNAYRANDKIYSIINAELASMYIGSTLNSLALQFQIYRARIMVLDSRSCYSWHKDQTQRLHLAVSTNEHCRMVFESGSYHIPADGYWYLTDTCQYHSAFNGGLKSRVHIVVGN